MCGLIGNFQLDGRALALDPLRHRGPDAEGSWLSSDHRCWLGHTRLAIQDLSEAGAQPISSYCGRFTLVFNGEIYNHHQVRQGMRFQAWKGHSDSETLVEGLAERGPPIVDELRGMFAFAAYDNQQGQLLLARDRLGIKPLYVSWHPEGVQFASERRALPGGDRLERQTISQVLAFGHDCTPADFPGPEIKSIVSLPPGMLVRMNHSRLPETVRYWPPQRRADWTPLQIQDLRSARICLRRLLEEVVAQHLQADVPVACFLSSGLDSGILAALACRQQPGAITTFTVALPQSSEDESVLARQMANHCNSQHHELVVHEADALALVKEALSALDVPTADGINTYLISRCVAAEGIKVAISGLGADELFGGYPSHRLMPWLELVGWLPYPIRVCLLQRLSPRLADKLSGLPVWDRWNLGLALRRWASDRTLAAAASEPLRLPLCPPQRISQAWGQTSWTELFGYAEPMLLRDSDVMSMACGLELRVPFLDHQLVEFALLIPQRFQRPGKGLLRQSCADLFPLGHLKRPKQGFVLPMDVWMLGPLREHCLSRLESLRQTGWLDPAWIIQQWQAFESGQLNWPRAWSLVVLGEFAEREFRR